ncbi:hypothetical protein SanaruYs_07100 [Chryseotalea sanaruensis]|uniref:FAD dependent oxidoreductase domain-containing protein n=1 Tax=Chryseotalea sanaruensis TaxID=2482724 RepID=A0A401U6I5_9BACT|nr:FAD-dependent oxidoreductase [Chryseotalea sanaruensis]GCC50495.1 hypothetical protein SanaruYs_07100 [Chryseotalea sanaruensis]
MKLRSKETYWLLKNGLITSYPTLQKNIACDILIIGGGITGSLMAYQLSQEGYETVLIDKRDIAMGSTSATTALLQYEIDEPLYSLIGKVGENIAVDSYREGVLALTKLSKIVKTVKANCEFKRKDSVYVADSQDDKEWLRKEFLSRQKFSLDVKWLSSSQLKDQYGVVGKAAILSTAAASMDAYKFAHTLLSHSIKHYGLKVYDHSNAEKVTYQSNSNSNSVITDNKCVITCKKIVYASGYETQQMLKKNIVTLNSTYAFISEPLLKMPKSLQDTIFWNTQNPYLYLRSTPDKLVGLYAWAFVFFSSRIIIIRTNYVGMLMNIGIKKHKTYRRSFNSCF